MAVLNIVDNSVSNRKSKCFNKFCSTDFVKKRIPIIGWLPRYKLDYLMQDVISGVTVGLTAIAQGIAYAIVAGLPPEYGLYGSLTSGIVYMVFGGCNYITIGPTAILSAMTAKYVGDYSPDFAVLAAFLSGLIILAMGALNLGFLVDFISMPVIKGFTTAGAMQIAASQLKSLFGTQGSSGNNFAESIYNFVSNIKTVKLWDPILGIGTIVLLVLLKKLGVGCKRTDELMKKTRWFISTSRNAVVVILGMLIAFIIKVILGSEPLVLIGVIGSGLPKFGLPAFSTTIGNETYNFADMMNVLGPQSVIIPLVAILESVAIAKAFAGNGHVDATQEMTAVGMCNLIGSFGKSMPITGSFARTALNHFSGVKTPAAGAINVLLIFVALTTLSSTFYYIPKASLGALITTAMFSMMEFEIFLKLWRNSVNGLLVLLITVVVSLFSGLEHGIIVGIIVDSLSLLYNMARPRIDYSIVPLEKGDVLLLPLCENISYCAAEYVREHIIKAISTISTDTPIVIDGNILNKMDITAVNNLMILIKDLTVTYNIWLLNFDPDLKEMCINVEPQLISNFVTVSNPVDLASFCIKDV